VSALRFFVEGDPAPKGSLKAIARKTRKGVRAIVLNDNSRTKPWSQTVAIAARQAMAGRALMTGPVQVHLTFYLARPKSVKRETPCVKPDVDKLQRAVFDALTGEVWNDDGQVVSVVGKKEYADGGMKAGVNINVFDLERQP
jgi:crossover junction endodeoxyribonuclease RusA